MTRRRKIIIAAIVIIVLLALAIWLYLVLRPKAAAPAAPAPETTTGENLPASGKTEVQDATAQLTALNPPPEPVVEQRPGYLQVAELFAERYGSYSNQESYANLRDLLPVMTDAYRTRTERLLEQQDGQPPAATYEGVTSVKISTKEIAYDAAAGTATVDVNLQQSKAVGTSAPQISYRILRVELEHVGEDWKVDSAVWR